MEVWLTTLLNFFTITSIRGPWNFVSTVREDFFFFFKFLAGPGCSSLGVGAFSENGPFRPNGEVLVKNEYSWNRGICFSINQTVFFIVLDVI